MLQANLSVEEIIEAYPDLTVEDIKASIHRIRGAHDP